MKNKNIKEVSKSIVLVFCIAFLSIIFFVLIAFNQSLENTLEEGYDFLEVLGEEVNYQMDTYAEILVDLSEDRQVNKIITSLTTENVHALDEINELKTVLNGKFEVLPGVSNFTIRNSSNEPLVNVEFSPSNVDEDTLAWQESRHSKTKFLYEYSLAKDNDRGYLIIKIPIDKSANHKDISLSLTIDISEIIASHWMTFGYQINIMDENKNFYLNNQNDEFYKYYESMTLDTKISPFFFKEQSGLSVSNLHYQDKRLFFINMLDQNNYFVMIKPYSKYNLSNIQYQVYTHLLIYVFLGFSVVGYFIFNHEATTKWIEKDRVFLNEIIDMDKIQISELKKELIFYQKMVAKAPMPVLFVDKNTLNIINANEKVVSFYGYSLSEIVQLSLPDLCLMENFEYDNPRIPVEHRLADQTIKEGYIRLQECSFGQTELLVVRLISNIQRPTKDESDIKYEIFHEIRSPLQGAFGAVDLIDQASDAYKEYTEIIKHSLNDVLMLTENVLSQGKLMGDHEKVFVEDFELKSLLDEVVQLIYYQDKHYNFISSKISKINNSEVKEVDQYTLRGDKMKLKQILINLMSNASKYTYDGEIYVEVEIESHISKDHLIFKVKDTGHGLSKEAQSELFSSYKTFHNSNTVTSTGLGLFVTKKYLEMLGGTIKIESELNKGSTFIFELDFESIEVDYNQAFNNYSILVVDDDSVSCSFLKHLLEKELLCFVKTLTNEGDLMNELSHREYDVLLIDENLNHFKGHDLIYLIRQSMNKRLQSMSIVLMSASKQSPNKNYDLIIKPFNKEVIIECLGKLLRIREKVKKDFEQIIDLDILKETIESVGAEVFKNLVQKFLLSAREDLAEIDTLIEKEFYEQIGGILHRFKGSLSYFGSLRCQPLLIELEALIGENQASFLKTYKVFRKAYDVFEKELKEITKNKF